MPKIPIIALDAMGGDHGPGVVVPAAVDIIEKHTDVRLILVGDEALLQQELSKQNKPSDDRLTIRHASQVVEMHDPPSQALRKKKDSSMRVAINLVQQGEAHAAVSAGNTGALMATAKFVLKTLPGIDRPAITTTLPTLSGHTHMLDLGANVDCTAEHLFQFAVMGSVLASAVDHLESPRVGLLNVGSEAIKGNLQVKEADRLLQNSSLNYIGYVEGDDIFKGAADVIVCDGFVGNVSLKTSEGVAKMVSHFLKQEFKRNWYNKLAAMIAMPVLNAFRSHFDPRTYNGATLLGLQGIVIKSHGGADAFAFAHAIECAMLEVTEAVPESIDKKLETLLERPTI